MMMVKSGEGSVHNTLLTPSDQLAVDIVHKQPLFPLAGLRLAILHGNDHS
jgi:hypothetical protein